MSLRLKQLLLCIFLSAFVLALPSCSFQKEADAKFGDQHFKMAIALIELHKVRFGEYPKSLNELKYSGDWDKIVFSAVAYNRLENGYELNLTRGWIGTPELNYPSEFWQGLGLVNSNVKTSTQ